MTKSKIDKATGNTFIQFKTIAPSKQVDGYWREVPNYTKKVLKQVAKESLAFAGVDISAQFQETNGDWKLYGKFPFVGANGKQYYWTGVGTENWKGFSIKIVEVSVDKATSDVL